MAENTKKYSRLSDIASRLKALRMGKGMTQKEVGAWVGATEGAVRTWEKGTTEPSLGRLEQLATKFNCDFMWLVFGDKPSQPDDRADKDALIAAKDQTIAAQQKTIEHLEARLSEQEEGGTATSRTDVTGASSRTARDENLEKG